MTRPLVQAGPSGGVARIGLSLKEITPLLYQSRKHVLFMTGILLALGMAGLFLIFKAQGRQFRRIREMEEQMRLQEELSSMGKLAAGVAHEIKNPLNAIGLVVQRLQKEFVWEDPQIQQDYDRFTRIVRDEISRVNRIIEQFLFVARPYRAEPEEQSLGEILDYVLALMEAEFQDKKIILKRTGEPRPFRIRGDRFQLTQALINIVNNAIEAMPRGGTLGVEIGEAVDPPGFEIRIRDSGPGIAPENRKHLFAHYFTTKEKGVGLGLAITRKIIEGHGGTVDLESVPGQGTTVRLRLPRAQTKNSA
jgi:signal transduction histidine kinase